MQSDYRTLYTRVTKALTSLTEALKVEHQLYAEYDAGDHSAARGEKIARQKGIFKEALNELENARQAMFDAGYVPPG
ncbi:MAG: hypothetical protein M3O35_10765 [Acidobacteriota bacterium]|nr:hypothetical protein [Acidobacteriota bacterium]